MANLSWRGLNARLPDLTEAQVQQLLDEEMVVGRRPVIAKRLHQRLSALRTTRERAEIMERVSK